MKIVKTLSMIGITLVCGGLSNPLKGMKRSPEISSFLLYVIEEALQKELVVTSQSTDSVIVIPPVKKTGTSLMPAPQRYLKNKSVFAPTSDTTYRCKKCIFFTKHTSRIRSHYRLHEMLEDHSKKIYSCKTCGFLAKASKAFREHAFTHQDARNYHCPMAGCASRVKTKRSLERHIKMVHEKKLNK